MTHNLTQRPRILVIDDMLDIHEDFRKVLAPITSFESVEGRLQGERNPNQFQVDFATQGEEGTEMVIRARAEGVPYQVAFVDMRMPLGWGGIETITRIWKADPDVQTVICTAYSDFSWSEILSELGQTDRLLILKKPFEPVEVSQLANALSQKWTLLVRSKSYISEMEAAVAARTRELQETCAAAVNMMEDSVDSAARAKTANLELAQEIAERKQTEKNLARLKRELDLLLSSTGQGIAGLDLSGNCTFINRAGAAMTGWEPQELIGRSFHELVHSKTADGSVIPADLCPLCRVFRVGESCQVETEVFWRRNAVPFPVEYSAHPIIDEEELAGAVVTFDDITEKKQLAAQYLRSQRMEAIGALAGGVAHDLNNALAPILMASELMSMQTADPKFLRLIENVQASATRGTEMVRQILTFARGKEGERGLVQPKHLVKEIVGIIQQTFTKDIRVRSELAPDLWPIVGNPTQVHQILLNLCVNARDAMPQGGTLSLAAQNVVIDEAYAGMSPEAKPGRYVMVRVSDSGTGMTPEIIARIFEPFFTTKPPGSGTGLGLSTVRSIVSSHHGFIRVESESGKGTTFKVYLPAHHGPAGKNEEATRPPLPAGNGELVLVVDDEASVRNMLAQVFQMFGYRVLTANNGAEAAGVCGQNIACLQLVLTDMDMPILGGPGFIQVVRALSSTLKIIGMSGLSSGGISRDLAGLKLHAFLVKPFTAEEMIRTVHQVLHSPEFSTPPQIPSK